MSKDPFPPGWEEKHRKSEKEQEKIMRPLLEAKLAAELSLLMEEALLTMNAEKAEQLEEMGEYLYGLGLFNGEVELPFHTLSLSESLISEYIQETNDGAKEEDDYIGYSFHIADGPPTIEKLKKEREKLEKVISRQQKKRKEIYTKKIEATYKSNDSWRKKKQEP